MKLSTDSINKLDLLVQTSLTAGIKKLIIEPNKIRGIDEKQSIVIITTDNVPDFNGKQVGINRLDSLAARLNLVKNHGVLEVEATEAANGNDIMIMDLSCGKTKAQFRCASIEAMRGIPKNVVDVPAWELKIGARALPTIAQAVVAMGSESVTLASRDGIAVSIELIDPNKDVFTTDLTDPLAWIGQGAPKTSFCKKYPAKTFVTLLKEALKNVDTVTATVGEDGTFSFKVHGFDFFILPSN